MRIVRPPAAPTGYEGRPGSVGRCQVMGILNVTPDSFSDGGRWATTETAVVHGIRLSGEGADIVDVGGESTRPGAHRISPEEELRRVIPVIEGLVGEGVAVSIDTMRATTADAAVAAGAVMVNDVSGGLADPDMVGAVAALGVPYVIMHWRAHSAHMGEWAVYSDDPVADVVRELQERVDGALAAGVRADRIVVDPGIGFAKEAEHNWALLAGLDRLNDLGMPVLVGASRKRFLGELLATFRGAPPPDARDAATHALSTIIAAAGAWCVRVHDVSATVDAVRVVQAMQAAQRHDA